MSFGSEVVADVFLSDKPISRRPLYFLKCSYKISPYRMGRGTHGTVKFLYEIGLHRRVKMTNGVFFAPESKFAVNSFFLFTKCGFRVVKSQTLATLSGGKLD